MEEDDILADVATVMLNLCADCDSAVGHFSNISKGINASSDEQIRRAMEAPTNIAAALFRTANTLENLAVEFRRLRTKIAYRHARIAGIVTDEESK